MLCSSVSTYVHLYLYLHVLMFTIPVSQYLFPFPNTFPRTYVFLFFLVHGHKYLFHSTAALYLCLQIPMFLNANVLQNLCSTVPMFPSIYIHRCRCSPVLLYPHMYSIFPGTFVLQRLMMKIMKVAWLPL